MFRPRKIQLTSLLLAVVAISLQGLNNRANADVAPGVAKALPPDVEAINSQLKDLDLLVVLVPLKLTSEQIEKVVAILEPISRSDDELTKQQCDALRAMAADIDKARSDTLKGNSPDPDAAAKINKMLADFHTKNVAAYKSAVDKVVEGAKATLTADQIKIVEHKYSEWSGGKLTLPAEFRDDAAKRNQYIEDSSLSAWADRIFLVQRTVPLLKALKTPATPAGAGTPAPGGGDKTTTAPPPAASPAK